MAAAPERRRNNKDWTAGTAFFSRRPAGAAGACLSNAKVSVPPFLPLRRPFVNRRWRAGRVGQRHAPPQQQAVLTAVGQTQSGAALHRRSMRDRLGPFCGASRRRGRRARWENGFGHGRVAQLCTDQVSARDRAEPFYGPSQWGGRSMKGRLPHDHLMFARVHVALACRASSNGRKSDECFSRSYGCRAAEETDDAGTAADHADPPLRRTQRGPRRCQAIVRSALSTVRGSGLLGKPGDCIGCLTRAPASRV